MRETRFKDTEIGVIPEDWEILPIYDIFKFKQGVQCDVENQRTTQCNGFIRFIRIIDLTQAKEPPRFIEDPGIIHHIQKDDLFMVRYGTPGIIGYGFEGVVANNLFRLIAHLKIDTKFYKYVFEKFYPQISALASSSTMPAVNFTSLSKFLLPKPPLPEQSRIASALTSVDNLISSLSKLIEKKKSIKRGAMQQLLTGKKRLKGFEEPWVEKRLGEIEIKNGSMLKSCEYKSGNIPVIAGGKSPAGFHNVFNREANTITISGSGASAGYVSFYEQPIFASDCSTINEQNDFEIKYLYFCLLYKQNEIYKCQAGGAQPHIHAKDINDISIMIPSSTSEQSAIASVLASMDAEIASLELKRRKYEMLKRGMMQELLTGRVRLK